MGATLDKLFVDPGTLPEDGYGFFQLLFLTMVYGAILFHASALISDGSELLLATRWRGLVGSVVLPVLGAVPDGAIVIFAGLGSDAQQQMNVGVGALAGSTVMLLTLPWSLAIFCGRVSLIEGQGQYQRPFPKRLDPPDHMGLWDTGVNCNELIVKNGRVMVVTLIGYIIIQGAGFTHHCDQSSYTASLANQETCAGEENGWAAAGCAYCTIAFFGYLYYQVRLDSDASKVDRAKSAIRKMIRRRDASFVNIFQAELQQEPASLQLTSNPVVEMENDPTSNGAATQQLPAPGAMDPGDGLNARSVLLPFFKLHDRNGNKRLDVHEFTRLLIDIGTPVPHGTTFEALHHDLDTDEDGGLTLEEVLNGLGIIVRELKQAQTQAQGCPPVTPEAAPHAKDCEGAPIVLQPGVLPGNPDDPLPGRTADNAASGMGDVGEAMGMMGQLDEDDNEDPEVPPELLDEDPAAQQQKIMRRSMTMMSIGTFIVLLVSDPMVNALSEIGDRTGIPAFYVSFLFAPLASNASELIAAYNYALKRTKKDITVSFASLLGAANMNNTFCLGIFLALVFCKSLSWQIAAETMSILVAELIMFFYSQRSTHTLFDALAVLSIYPLTMGLVASLEAAGLN